MKYAAISLLLLAGVLKAEDEAKDEAKPPPDSAKVLNDLTAANAAKKVGDIGPLLDAVIDVAKSNKDEALAESLAGELTTSFKVCKGNWGQLKKIVAALGELRAKKGVSLLKKVAFQKKARSEDDELLQAAALDAIAMYRESRYINGIAEMCKNRSKVVAKGAYASFRHYGPEKGKTRKKIAELLMKRLDMEYPSSGGQGGASVSAEKQERWAELSPVIVQSMQSICRMNTINEIDVWREWWKENKSNSKAWKDEKS